MDGFSSHPWLSGDDMNEIILIFLILVLGYAAGRITICGLSLGSSGVLLIALVMGHFGYTIPALIKNIGLAAFVTAVGILAGPVFLENFKKRAISYIILGVVIICVGALTTVIAIKLSGFPKALVLGLMNGALTSTPGLAAALESTGNDSLASVGYGIAYPFGVIGVVLFVQLIPRITKADMRTASALANEVCHSDSAEKSLISIDSFGFFPFSLAVVSGMLLGAISIPLPGGASFSLGSSGGPLITGLLVGGIGHIGPINITPKRSTMEVMREFGLVLFLMGAGTEAGNGFVAVLKEYGLVLFFIGVLITLLPMAAGYIISTYLLKIDVVHTLGAICGGMTSTPALGTLLSNCRSESASTAYAATYPVALTLVVLSSQFIGLLL